MKKAQSSIEWTIAIIAISIACMTSLFLLEGSLAGVWDVISTALDKSGVANQQQQ